MLKLRNYPDQSSFLEAPIYAATGKKFSELTPQELNQPETQNKLLQAMYTHLNSGDLEAIISTGDKGADRWINDRVWNAAIGVPKSMIVNRTILNFICLAGDQPLLGYSVATTLQFANQFLSSDAYYAFRKKFIGQ